MSDSPQLILIRKLLAKAEDPAATPEEAETYTNKAMELLVKYGIDEALLAASGVKKDEIISVRIHMDAPYATDKCALLHRIAMPLRCRTVRYRTVEPSRGQSKKSFSYSMMVCGYASDIERVELLFTSLLMQAANGSLSIRVPYGENAKAYRASWYDGFSMAIYTRLSNLNHAQTKQTKEADVTIRLACRQSLYW